MKKLIALMLCAVLTASPVLASEGEPKSDGDIFEDVIQFISEKADEAGSHTGSNEYCRGHIGRIRSKCFGADRYGCFRYR